MWKTVDKPMGSLKGLLETVWETVFPPGWGGMADQLPRLTSFMISATPASNRVLVVNSDSTMEILE